MALQTKTYSIGSFDRYTGTSNGYILDLILTEASTDLQANTSQVDYKLQLRSGPSNRFDWEFTSTLWLNGAQVASSTAEKYLDYNATWVLLEGHFTVPHRADGSLDMAFSATVTPWNGGTAYTPPEMTLSGTMALTQIARASAIAATPAYIGDVSTVAVSRRDPSCTHTVFYTFGSLSGYLASATGALSDTPVQLTDTTILFPIPETFYGQIPDAPSGVCTLRCTTYAGAAELGEAQTATFTVTADPNRCGPVVSGTAVDTDEAVTALTGSHTTFVKGVSDVLCTPTAGARQGASLQECWVNGRRLTGAAVTLTDITADQVVFRATDSRGYSAEYTVPGLSFLDYVPVSCTASAKRTDPTGGQAILTVTGKWFSGSFGRAQNTLSVRYRVSGGDWVAVTPTVSGGDFTAQATLSGLDYTCSHTIEVQVADALQTLTKQVTLGRGVPVFDWGENDFAFHVPVRFTATDGTGFTLDLVDGQLTAIIT